ncbi:hypothetical protein [Tsukamurella tyrosinosolvens]|uniref:hypothetical protein n=1 Tax=Tsukamurella tyrosinosolvens TaxID=57704 RepID=UPI00079C09A9|nr:hypothetical protein [Tsukamurella tyrosinosolvens]KXP06891.1 hypothetical protein AXK59_01895 [Tsukamurella tyrosinosolvens]
MTFRFAHDVSHVLKGLSFSGEDELELAAWHLEDLASVGFGPDSLEYALFEADLVGNVLLVSLAKRFAFNQLEFVLGIVEHGLPAGLKAEIQRTPQV